MDVTIMFVLGLFVLGMFTGAGLLITFACILINASKEDPKPKSKEEWHEVD